jgi:ribosomal protein S18 acetylase RimI-like enzyme
MELTFRRATENDWRIVLRFEQFADSRLVFAYLKEDEVKRYIQTSNVYLILLDDQPIGDVSYEKKGPDRAYVDGLNVLPEFRGQGHAAKALEWLLKELGTFRTVDLHVHPENSHALVIYLKLGFKIKSWEDNHFGDGQPRLALVREW